ncbi:MAG: ECF transporter S component [Clostridia bacterium]|nr:ECF transporter S component [Clostridia bacterium]
MQESGKKFRIIFSEVIASMSLSLKIAYMAIVAALAVVISMFTRIPITPSVQISLKIFVSILSGILLGGGSGFFVCMTSDFLGWLSNPGAQAYSPWVGLSAGMLALFSGVLINNFKTGNKLFFYLKCVIICLFSLFVCTIGINTTAFYFIYGIQSTYIEYVIARMFIGGQIWNSLANYALLFILLPILSEVKPLKRFFV